MKYPDKQEDEPVTGYVFWPYDLFPYVLAAGKTDRPHATKPNFAYVPTYQSYVKPLHTMTVEDGALMKRKLEALRIEYREASIKLLRDYEAKAIEVAPFLKGFPHYNPHNPSTK